MDAIEWVRRGEELGAGEIVVNSIDRDGTASGYDLEITRAVADAVNVPVIASGGAGTAEHIADGLTDRRRVRRDHQLDPLLAPPRPQRRRPGAEGGARHPRRPDAPLGRDLPGLAAARQARPRQ